MAEMNKNAISDEISRAESDFKQNQVLIVLALGRNIESNG
jgi:hypothetical protein